MQGGSNIYLAIIFVYLAFGAVYSCFKYHKFKNKS
jgi:hypothetical protein